MKLARTVLPGLRVPTSSRICTIGLALLPVKPPQSQHHVVEAVVIAGGQGEGDRFDTRGWARGQGTSGTGIVSRRDVTDENRRADRVYPPISTSKLLMPAITKEIGKVFIISEKNMRLRV